MCYIKKGTERNCNFMVYYHGQVTWYEVVNLSLSLSSQIWMWCLDSSVGRKVVLVWTLVSCFIFASGGAACIFGGLDWMHWVNLKSRLFLIRWCTLGRDWRTWLGWCFFQYIDIQVFSIQTDRTFLQWKDHQTKNFSHDLNFLHLFVNDVHKVHLWRWPRPEMPIVVQIEKKVNYSSKQYPASTYSSSSSAAASSTSIWSWLQLSQWALEYGIIISSSLIVINTIVITIATVGSWVRDAFNPCNGWTCSSCCFNILHHQQV